MKGEYRDDIAVTLNTIPAGTFNISKHNTLNSEKIFLSDKITTQTKGKGKADIYLVYPGIEVSFNYYLADKIIFHHEALGSVLEINHCRRGRIGWNMRNGATVFLGAGDLCIHTMECCADSEIVLPLGYYEGVSISFNMDVLKNELPEILKEINLDMDSIYHKLFIEQMPFGIPSSNDTERVFSALYDCPDNLAIAYYKLKAQEILLYLAQLNVQKEKELTPYISQHTQLIKEIRDYLVEHLDERFTIEELSKKYLINTSTLKSVFKAVYGLPIASYVKEYRIKEAIRLLRETNDSIALIAEKVGYESQGKFAKAFKDSLQILPTEYRKIHQNRK